MNSCHFNIFFLLQSSYRFMLTHMQRYIYIVIDSGQSAHNNLTFSIFEAVAMVQTGLII